MNGLPAVMQQEGLVKAWMVVALLALGMAALGGCTEPADCSGGDFGGGCVSSTGASVAAASPGTTRVLASPTTVAPTASPPATGRGDPSAFAVEDDKQCRSYGLIFGTWEYAQCRIRLSAQHRGLDPDIGATTPTAGSK